jgi:Leucine-rich repeat (LRR) protein
VIRYKNLIKLPAEINLQTLYLDINQLTSLPAEIGN